MILGKKCCVTPIEYYLCSEIFVMWGESGGSSLSIENSKFAAQKNKSRQMMSGEKFPEEMSSTNLRFSDAQTFDR